MPVLQYIQARLNSRQIHTEETLILTSNWILHYTSAAIIRSNVY